ncbi:MAG: integration host factor subunit beta [Gammaproteobacteria bacterium]|nr:integration host factor subunit beta [Gammaproteobacteria bacterium]
MTKSEIIELIARKQTQFSQKDVEIAVNQIVDSMIETLSQGERIEIRGFGSFCLHHRKARVGRNPKTGETVELSDKRVPHFKPGKSLRERVDSSKETTDILE